MSFPTQVAVFVILEYISNQQHSDTSQVFVNCIVCLSCSLLETAMDNFNKYIYKGYLERYDIPSLPG